MVDNSGQSRRPNDLLQVPEFEPGQRQSRGSSLSAPPLFSLNAPHSIYDSLNATALSYRLGINILTIIVVGHILLLICFMEVFYTDEIQDFMMQFKKDPTGLVLVFLVVYVAGCVMMVPPNGVLIIVAYTFSKVWGTTWGNIYAIIFNFFAQHLAHLVTFVLGRLAFRDMIYTKMIRYKKFFVLNRAIHNHGTYINFLARISFMCPHPLLTYALSVTDITFKQFINGNHSILPLSFFYVYIGSSVSTLQDALDKKGNFWERAEIYYFALTMTVLVVTICSIWSWVGKEVARFERDFDEAHPGGFDLKRAQQIELKRMEEERKRYYAQTTESTEDERTQDSATA